MPFCPCWLVGFFLQGALTPLLTPEGRCIARSRWSRLIVAAVAAPRRPLRRDCLFLLACVISACLVVMCRNSAPSSAFSGERGTGIAPRFRIRGMLLPRRPPRSSAKLSSQGLLVICCVSAPPLSSITLLIRHYPTHKKKRSVLRQRSGTEPRFF